MKKILAVAIATAFAAPAFAATSNVDVYGKLHASVNFYSDEPSGISNLGITSNASRIGFKGSEDLGGGLKGIWQIESGLNMDEQTGTLASRNSFIGLSGGFGTALIGNHDTPLKLVGRKVDLFGDTQGDSRNVMAGGSDLRAKNVVAYISPNFSGFSGAFAYSTDPVVNASNNGESDDLSVYNLNVEYGNGPIYVGFGYGDGDGHEAIGAGAHWRLAGSFSFGDFKVVGQYDSLEDDNAKAPGYLDGDYDAWMVGGAFKMGAMTFKANYMAGEEDSNSATAADPEQFSIGVDYAMSKRTTVYAMWINGEDVTLGAGGGASDRVCGNAASCAPFSSGGVPTDAFANSGDISAISVGVVHNF